MKRARGPTLRDVANSAGVSTATVSFVLNNTKPVAPETRARVEVALAALDYRISPSARALRTGRHHAIGLLLPDLANPFFPALAQAVTDAAWARNHALILASSGRDPATEAEALAALAERADGIIWIPNTDAPHPLPTGPTVILDRPSPALAAFDSISADHRAGGALVAAAFRAQGRHRIGLLAGPAASPSAASRIEGFLANAAGLSLIWHHELPFTFALPEAATAWLADPRLDGVFAASDVVAIGALRILRSLGRIVPHDVAVIGFDDIPWAALTEPPLTTIRQPVTALGAQAVATLFDRIAHPDRAATQHRLPVSLIERQSTP
ncbi:LacI family transcriptional regulator [Acidiphilium sp. PA]|uniref:LacI family DNA-binding transcriptional regulator n=1 Tax=Acidiphilium sp. PA TaxID=2871705 RepID=UPI0022437457|nr:LacI family DNA-binding transcriptional regulator [Acidiphilium sp. PA]MCW8307786.1 LacI family transcriptional regulator [Acidiphilium sp. PA]